VNVPPKRSVETDRISSKQDLRTILENGSSRDKAVALLAISSGLRISTIMRLSLKDIDLERKIPVIRPDPSITKFGISFLTFASPEAKTAIEVYLEQRLRLGGTITPESRVFVTGKGKSLNKNTSGYAWRKLLVRSGFTEESRTRYTLHFHTLRKFFATFAFLAGVPLDLLDFFLGHRDSMRRSYLLPDCTKIPEEVIQVLEKEYLKALPALTLYDGSLKVMDRRDRRIQELEEMTGDSADRLAALEREVALFGHR
jgi:integrase